MSTSPRDFPGWMQAIERQVRNNGRSAMRGVSEVKDTLGGVATDLDKLREDLENLPVNASQPAAPVELTGQSSLYIGPDGRRYARLSIDFPDVIRSADGHPIIVTDYELQGYEQTATRLQDSMASYPGIAYPGSTYPGTPRYTKGLPPIWADLGTSNTSSFTHDLVTPGQVWVYRVRAADGLWSQPLRIETRKDDTPPPQPGPFTVESVRGTLVVRWNGMAVTGPQPADYEYTVLAISDSPNPSLLDEAYRFGATGGNFVLPGIPYYETRFFRLRSVDQSGNWSVWSEQVAAYPVPLVDTDIIINEIDAAKTHLINVDAGVSILDDTIVTEHLHVTESMTAAMAQFLHVKADMLEANDIWADNAWLGYAEAALVKADMFVGREFVGGTFTGATFRTAVSGNRTELTEDGIRQVDGLGRDLLRIGYGIETGMSLRNPGTGNLTPLGNVVFGGHVWTSPRAVTQTLGQDVQAGGSSASFIDRDTPYTAVSSSVMMMVSQMAWTRHTSVVEDGFSYPGNAQCQVTLVPARSGVTYPKTLVGNYVNIDVKDPLGSWSPDPVGAASDSWFVMVDGLIPGEQYHINQWLFINRRPTIWEPAYNSEVPYMRQITLSVKPTVYIIPR